MSAETGSSPPLLPEPAAPPPSVVLRRLFLTLFLRGRGARGLRRKTSPKSIQSKLWLTLGIYTLFGCLALGFIRQPVFVLSVYLHALTFTFLGMYVASSAGEVLFNKEENDILLHRPISARAMLGAKVQVLVQVSLWLAGCFNLAGLVVGAFAPDGGWRFPLVHALSTVLEALFCTGSVVLGYQLCLRCFGRERLEGLITTAQVFVSVAAVVAGQIVPRVLFRPSTAGAVRLATTSRWTLLLPPAWFAGLDDALAGSGAASSWWLALGSVAGTAAVLGAAFGLLARTYQVGMQSINETVSTRKRNQGKRRWLDLLASCPPLSWCLRDSVSRASFVLIGAYLFRDRDIKLRLYPGLAPMLVMPFVILFQGRDFQHDGFHGANPIHGLMVAFSGCYLGMIPMLGLSLLRYSQQWQASDVFRAAPLAGPAAICRGARWAVFVFLTVPVIGVILVAVRLLQTAPGEWVALLPGVLTLPIYALVPYLGPAPAVPLSLPTEEAKATNRGMVMIIVMIASLMVAGLAALAKWAGWFWPFLGAEALVVLAIGWGMTRSIATLRWHSIE